MKIRYILLFALLVAILISFLLILFSKEFFIVKNIVIDKDFNVNNEKFIHYLGIQANRYIWEYNVREMEGKLAKQVYLENFYIKKQYPDTLFIFLRIRKPIARLLIDKEVMFIDKNGFVFKESEESKDLPLLTYHIKEYLNYGTIVPSKYSKIIDILLDLKKKNSNIYKNIEEVNIIEESSNIKYFVKYRGINNNIYLKNFINVDLLKKGFVFSLYLQEVNIEVNRPYFAGLGFVY